MIDGKIEAIIVKGNKKKKKKGSTAIMLSMIFVSMTVVLGVITEASSIYVAQSQAEATFELAGRSVLASYFKPLKERYGLFGFRRSEKDIENEIIEFAGDSLMEMDLTEMKIDHISAIKGDFNLTNTEIFKDQILEYMKYKILIGKEEGLLADIKGFLSGADEIGPKIEELENEVSLRDAEKDENKDTDPEGQGDTYAKHREKRNTLYRKLKNLINSMNSLYSSNNNEESNELINSRILNSLPSYVQRGTHNSLFVDIKELIIQFNLNDTLTTTRNNFYIDEYIMTKFRNHNTYEWQSDSFFENEVEYIISAKTGDTSNYSSVKKYLFTLRMGLNTAYLYKDVNRKNETMALATVLTPGPEAKLTQLLLISAWAALESKNDIRTLEDGKKVPIIKTDETWATGLDRLLEEGFGNETIQPTVNEGLDYQGYLRLILKIVDVDKKLLRAMDLIQINIKGGVTEEFMLSDCFAGFGLYAEVGKKNLYSGIGQKRITVNMIQSY